MIKVIKCLVKERPWNKWGNIPYSKVRRLNIKKSILPKLIYKFNIILIKSSKVFCRQGQAYSKIYVEWKGKRKGQFWKRIKSTYIVATQCGTGGGIDT